MLYGQFNNGKTLAACGFAISVGTGRSLFGRFLAMQGSVLFVKEDGHPQRLPVLPRWAHGVLWY